jgi:filamentous hemagglutinin
LLTPADIPVSVVVRDGQMLIANTRSAVALEAAGIPRSAWAVIDQTGNSMWETIVTDMLRNNGLTSAGIDTVRMTSGA